MGEPGTRVHQHDLGYRKGLVLGLTMAEVMVLILFMLLLIIGSIIASMEERQREDRQRIAKLSQLERYVSDLLSQSNSQVTVQDIIEKIQRDERENARLRAQLAEEREDAADGKLLKDILHKIAPSGGKVTPEQIKQQLSRVSELQHENDTIRGQLTQLSNQVKATGKGNEYPSCWVTPDGKTQSIFNLVLTPHGIRIEDRPQPDRAADRALLPLASVQYGAELSLNNFLSQARPLYDWSVAHGCRFYVVRRSTAGSAPIQSVNAISYMFYPDSSIQVLGDR